MNAEDKSTRSHTKANIKHAQGIVIALLFAGCKGAVGAGPEYSQAMHNALNVQGAPAKAAIEETANLITRGSTENSKKVGEWFYYYGDNSPLARGSYDRGVKAGFWEYWYRSGELWIAGQYEVSEEDGRVYSEADGLWIVLDNDGTLDRLPGGSLKCDGVNLYSETYWSSRVDWQTLSESGIRLIQEILPHGISFQGPGYYVSGNRSRLLTVDEFKRAAVKAK